MRIKTISIFFRKCKINNIPPLRRFCARKCDAFVVFFPCFYFVGWFWFDLHFCAFKSFWSKKKKTWNCPDNLIYYTTIIESFPCFGKCISYLGWKKNKTFLLPNYGRTCTIKFWFLRYTSVTCLWSDVPLHGQQWFWSIRWQDSVNSNILKVNLIFCIWVDYGGREWSFANFSKLWKTEKTNKYSLKAILS